jgi:hypothetical protein
MTVRAAGEQVSFPVAGDRPVVCLRGPLTDRDGVDDLALAAVDSFRGTRPPDRAAPTQMRHQLAFQGAPCLHEQAQIDLLVRHPHSLIVREAVLQPARDLLWRPLLLELPGDQNSQQPIAGQLADLRPPPARPGPLVSRSGPVATPAAMTGDLPAHRRRCPAQTRSNPPHRLASRNTARSPPLTHRQRQPAPPPRRRHNTPMPTDQTADRRALPIKRPSNLTQRLTPPPPLPQLPTLLRRILATLPHRNPHLKSRT